MKKRIFIILCSIVIMISLIACGQPAAGEGTGDNRNSSDEETMQEKEEETPKPKEEEAKEEDLPYWIGVEDNFGYSVDFSENSVSIDLEYPSLKPTSYGWAYQKDAAYIGVFSPGYDEDFIDLEVDTLENTFAIAKAYFCKQLENDRSKYYSDFDFQIETAEPVEINGFSMYKYTGIHTYTYDGEQRECDFVAYSIDTGQIEHSYPTIIVINDTLSNPGMDPISKETMEAYARKMAESVKITKYWWEE